MIQSLKFKEAGNMGLQKSPFSNRGFRKELQLPMAIFKCGILHSRRCHFSNGYLETIDDFFKNNFTTNLQNYF